MSTRPAGPLGGRDRRHDGFVPAVDRHPLEELGPLHGAARPRAADRVQDFGHAQSQRDRLAAAKRRRDRAAPAR